MRKMIDSLALGIAASIALLSSVPAFAQTTTPPQYEMKFDFDNGPSRESSGSFSFSSLYGGYVNVRATAYHANDRSGTTTTAVAIDDVVSASRIGEYQNGGLGVKFASDTGNNGTHQIDNIRYNGETKGVDFILLHFDAPVILTGLDRHVYSLPGVSIRDSDAAVFGFTTATRFGTNLTNFGTSTNGTIDERMFTTVAGGSSSSSVFNFLPTNRQVASNVWLVSASFNPDDRDDGFKLAGITIITAVPEPATWAMMIAGFGAVGGSLRRRRNQTVRTLTA